MYTAKNNTKKRFLSALLAAAFIFSLASCADQAVTDKKEPSETSKADTSSPAGQSAKDKNGEKAKKAVVVYFSATGTTAEVAKLIAEKADADILEIVPEDKYTSEDLNYRDNNCRANREMNDSKARPEIAGDLSAAEEYDTVYLGYPIWWGTAPRIIQTFLESCDMSGKTVCVFCTSGGSGIEQSINDLNGLYSNVNIISGKRFSRADTVEIESWLDSIE